MYTSCGLGGPVCEGLMAVGSAHNALKVKFLRANVFLRGKLIIGYGYSHSRSPGPRGSAR